MGYTIIGNGGFKRYFKHAVRKQYKKDTYIKSFDDAIIVNQHKNGFGVFDKDFHFIPESLQTRRNKSQFIPSGGDPKDIQYVDKEVVFIGNVNPYFGHFLLEHMNRIYALLDKRYASRSVVLINDKGLEKIPGYIYSFLELFGIKRDKIIILNETTRFKNVCIPSQGFNARLYTTDAFAKTFDIIAKNVPDGEVYEKIYVSRAMLDDKHKTLGEERVQKIFEKNGYKVIYPEKLPVQTQVSLVKNCRVLAGCAGTALHLALFMKPGGTVVQIKRNRISADNAMIQNNVNNTKNLNGIFVSGSVETVKTFHSTDAPQIIGVNKYMKMFFDKYGFKYTDNDLKFDDVAWRQYKAALAEYNKTHGNVLLRRLKRLVIKITSCFVPNRRARSAYRTWLKRVLNYN